MGMRFPGHKKIQGAPTAPAQTLLAQGTGDPQAIGSSYDYASVRDGSASPPEWVQPGTTN